MVKIIISDLSNEQPYVLKEIAKCLNALADAKTLEIDTPIKSNARIIETKSGEKIVCRPREQPIETEEEIQFDPTEVFKETPNALEMHQEISKSFFITNNALAQPATPIIDAISNANAKVTQNGIELDARGFPWDARIHSREKSKLKDGAWRIKRGVADSYIKKIESELKQLVKQSKDTVKTITEEVIEEVKHVNIPPLPPVVDPIHNPQSVIPPIPAIPVVPSITFPSIMEKVTAGIRLGKLSHEQFLMTIRKLGINDPRELDEHKEKLVEVDAAITAAITGSK